MSPAKFLGIVDALASRDGLQTQIDAVKAFYILTGAAFALFILCAGLIILDPRLFGPELTWIKPTKFAASFGLLFLTQALVLRQLSAHWRFNLGMVSMAVVSGCAMVFEMGYMMYQASVLEASHWNDTSAFYAMMYGLMGVGATGLMVSAASVGAAAVFDQDADLDFLLKLGIALGFGLSFILTFLVAGEMAAGGGRYIGVPSDNGPRVPLFGWSREVGDLRPSHFLSLHAMQILPIFALVLPKTAFGVRMLLAISTGYVVLTVLVMIQAMAGHPLY